MMEGVGVAHKLLKNKKKKKRKEKKNKKKITIQIFDKATSVKTIYKQSSGMAETASVVSQFQLAIVLGGRKKISGRPFMHLDGETEMGGIWYSCYQPQTGTYSCQ